MKEAPSLATITSSLNKCSVNDTTTTTRSGGAGNGDVCGSPEDHDALLSQWEQCFDLETGEVYYINWKTGEQSQEDPRMKTSFEQGEEENKDSWCESDKSTSSSSTTTESSPLCSSATTDSSISSSSERDDILVVAGCRNCLMYYMLPKRVEQCPKCNNSFLLHFDQPPNTSS